MALLKGMKLLHLWMLFILAVSSAELLNEIPIDNLYREENEVGVESPALDEQVADEYGRPNEVLYKLMNYLQRGPVVRPRYQDDENMDDAKATWSLLTGIKTNARRVKRWLSFFDTSTAKPQTQRKLNTKKPKGPKYRLCLLKVCAFPKEIFTYMNDPDKSNV